MAEFLVGDVDETELIRHSNAIQDVQSVIPQLPLSHCSKGASFSISYCTGTALNPKQTLKIFQIFESNMKVHYEETWGWSRNDKMKELFHPSSRFLVVSNAKEPLAPAIDGAASTKFPIDQIDASEIIGYTIYRFDWDDEDEPEHPVLYIYELQIAASHHGHGIGRLLTSAVILIADTFRMWKVMLTCFKRNEAAMGFYLNCGFGIDCNSPSSFGHNDEEHEILSNRPSLK